MQRPFSWRSSTSPATRSRRSASGLWPRDSPQRRHSPGCPFPCCRRHSRSNQGYPHPRLLERKPEAADHRHDDERNRDHPGVATYGLNESVGHLTAWRRKDEKCHALANDQRTQAHGERLQSEIGDEEAVQGPDDRTDGKDRREATCRSKASGAGRRYHDIGDRDHPRPGQIQLAA